MTATTPFAHEVVRDVRDDVAFVALVVHDVEAHGATEETAAGVDLPFGGADGVAERSGERVEVTRQAERDADDDRRRGGRSRRLVGATLGRGERGAHQEGPRGDGAQRDSAASKSDGGRTHEKPRAPRRGETPHYCAFRVVFAT